MTPDVSIAELVLGWLLGWGAGWGLGKLYLWWMRSKF